jgi:uncharacterized MnhB-related membrane protein
MAVALDLGLVALVLALAVFTLVARRGYAAVLGFVAYGLLVALAWVRLSAADVALTEAAIGSGLTGALLLGAAARLRATEASGESAPAPARRLAAALLATVVALALAAIVLWLPQPAPTLGPAVAQNLAATGLGNPVTGVLMAFRGVDTFLEKVVLLLALVCLPVAVVLGFS